MTIYTVGYEGCDIDQFIHGLKENKITCIIDIRKNPVSRKKGFSKSRLRENLAARGIDYVHFGSLGVPSAWRKKQKAKLISRSEMFADYVDEILPTHETEIQKVIATAKEAKRAALLCYEADAGDCHRHFLAEEIRKHIKVKIVDLDILPEQSHTLFGVKPRKKAS